MSKNIQTHNADINLIKKFLDYANCADASYARLEYIHKNIGNDKKADNLTFGDKLQQDIKVKDDKGNLLYIKPKGTNTAYACAIEARFNEGLIVETKQYFCIPFSEVCLGEKEIAINNDITKVGLDFPISARTKIFTNRFRILAHQKNTDSGFSATLFEDTEDNKQKIFAIRGTEPSDWEKDIVDADMDLMFDKLPSNQYIDMIKFYAECIADKHITEFTPLVIVGHSLGGCLAQLLTLSLATSANTNNVKEVYTFNSPGAKNLRIDEDTLGRVYTIDSTILNAKDKERALFKKIRGYEHGEKDNLLRDTTLIGYDNYLFNAIYKYFVNNENLKEHSILVRTFAMSNMSYIGNSATISSVTYTYEIFAINETFIKCLNTLKANNLSKQPLACQDSIHHIESDDDSNPNNNQWQDELIQNLGIDIDGKHYYVNIGIGLRGTQYITKIGNGWFESHALKPTIHTLRECIGLMNAKRHDIKTLLDFNLYKDKNRLALISPLHTYECLPPYPTLT